MFPDDAKYPIPTADRRLRAASRPNTIDRRRDQRFRSNFPVSIHVGEGDNARVYRATACDISDSGLLLENVDVPLTETRLRVNFLVPEGTLPEEFGIGPFTLDGDVRRRNPDKKQLGFQFQQPISTRLAQTTWPYMRGLATLAMLVSVILVVLIKLENLYYFWFDVPVFLYSLLVGGFLLTRYLFAAFYRPAPHSRGDLPSVSIIFPVYDEEKYIERTLVQALEVTYPRDRLQVIAVNDGSRDQSFRIMMDVQKKYPELVLVNLERTMGKRGALSAGAQLATGEILILSDSDSFFQRDAVREVVDAFADPEVGAVTGHCDVENAWTNLLTKMQAVRYYISFRVMKAAESVFDCVTCLSGPFAAYRREVFDRHASAWLNQRWMGAPATYGDDRSLTNLVLRSGQKVIYQSRARCTTIVPEDYGTFLRQQMRWKRSWFRESLRACAFMWRKPPLASLSFYLGVLLPILGPLVVFRALLYLPIVQNISPLMYLFGILLMSCMMSSVYLLARRSRLWIYGIPFCFFYIVVMVWQLPWAMLTLTHGKWGTR
jgi:hyaluronan synthase